MGWAQIIGRDGWAGPIGGSTHGDRWSVLHHMHISWLNFVSKVSMLLVTIFFPVQRQNGPVGLLTNGAVGSRNKSLSLQRVGVHRFES